MTDIGDEAHARLMQSLKPILRELVALGTRAAAEHSGEASVLNKITQCIRIVEFIEDEYLVNINLAT